ncbi:transporter substrate-binding domain-containing protein [Vagococcus humatus]|uniref:ABC transporter substrate-binding protein n=1 Tax=Vagococcus humatus TaxID=1889241 RepID=A0A429Z586_9ENTE|nr:transporter substrate-binding domain-containing protein [Vagococcus humatus]RST88834.1 ABC transporter substrate-binding protein [Vagococcus humatus]
MKKKLVFFSLLSIMTMGLIGCVNSSEKSQKVSKEDNSWKAIQNKGTLTVGTSGTLFPTSYYNDKNELTGYDIEVIKDIAKRLHLVVKFKEYNVDGTIAALNNGTIDLAANDFSLNKERAKQFSLSTPIKHSFDSMIVRKKDNSEIHSLEDLKGKKAAGESSTGYMKIAEKFGATLVSYDNATNDQYLTDVANGRTDVILNDYYLQKMSVNALPHIPVKILEGVYFNPSSSGFLFRKDQKILRQQVNEELNNMEEDGTLSKLAKQFFGDDVSKQPQVKVNRKVSVN